MIRSASSAVRAGMRPARVPRRADASAAFYALGRLRGSIAPAAVNSIAAAIQTQEGYAPGTLAWQNNNPGNLVYVGQAGASAGAGGFARFASYADGYNALVNQINLDVVRGSDANGRPVNNISDLIASWAPASDPRNDTAAYVASVVNQTGFDPSAPFDSLTPASGAAADAGDSAPAAVTDFLAPLQQSVDLSAVGISSAVPLWGLLAAGALAAVVFFRR